jgi:hypothetical protein
MPIAAAVGVVKEPPVKAVEYFRDSIDKGSAEGVPIIGMAYAVPSAVLGAAVGVLKGGLGEPLLALNFTEEVLGDDGKAVGAAVGAHKGVRDAVANCIKQTFSGKLTIKPSGP